jgi:excisionase family DNA binding protein
MAEMITERNMRNSDRSQERRRYEREDVAGNILHNAADSMCRPNIERFVTADEVCDFLNISKSTLDRKCRRRELPCYRIGSGKRSARRFRLSEIEQAIQSVRR